MIYEANAKILKMFDKDFVPGSVEGLENVLNTVKRLDGVSVAFDRFETWFEEVGEKADTIRSMSFGVRNYFRFLKQFLVIPTDYDRVFHAVHELNFYTGDNRHKVFSLVKTCYCLEGVPEIKLINEISLEDVNAIYKKFVQSYRDLYDWIIELERKLCNNRATEWRDKIFDGSGYCGGKVEGPQFMMVSFCENPLRYTQSTQKFISTMVINTKSRKTWQNRDYGFLYSFKESDLFAMNTESLSTITMDLGTFSQVFDTIITLKPLSEAFQEINMTMTDTFAVCPFDAMQLPSSECNEIVLKKNAIPYGIYVFQEALAKNYLDVCSLCTVNRIPLFISETDGNLIIVPWQSVFKDTKKYFN